MTTPTRIQRRRTKGWRMPATAIHVGRGTRWGNPYAVKTEGRTHTVIDTRTGGVIYSSSDNADARRVAVAWYRPWLDGQTELVALARQQLRGRDLACWCPLGGPCHAEVLLRVANG